jgi:hypothetical protein
MMMKPERRKVEKRKDDKWKDEKKESYLSGKVFQQIEKNRWKSWVLNKNREKTERRKIGKKKSGKPKRRKDGNFKVKVLMI